MPLYGEADAGRIWNRTLVRQLVRVQKFNQSEYDPCYFWKHLSDGTRMDIVMYVDDGYAVDSFSAAAMAELDALHRAFTIAVKPARFFLGNNVTVFLATPRTARRRVDRALAGWLVRRRVLFIADGGSIMSPGGVLSGLVLSPASLFL